MKKIKGFFYNRGVHVPDHKVASGKPIEVLPTPQVVSLSLSMGLGRPAEPLVAVGDKVRKGTLIGKSGGFISSNLHSSICGEVIAIATRPNATGAPETYIDIKNNGLDEVDYMEPLSDPGPDEIKKRVLDAGIVGMGGDGFPTAVKLSPKTPVDILIINGAECEPYLTCDHRLMLERSDEVVRGARYFAKAIGCKEIIIGIEANKPDAIEIFEKYDDIKVVELKKQYPMGGEKQLIYCTTKRKVPLGKLPADAGCNVQNVSTCYAACQAIEQGKPLIDRVMTCAGDGVKEPKNILVPLGTKLSEVVEFCGGQSEKEAAKLISGGPMMGFAMIGLDSPTKKTSSGLLLLSIDEIDTSVATPCLNCGRCADVCSMKLMPMNTVFYAKAGNFEMAAKMGGVMNCIECGACAYVCPAKQPFLQNIRLAKAELRKRG